MIANVGLFIWGTLNLSLGAPAVKPQITGEIKSYQQIGDKTQKEFARLHLDGSMTKTLTYGDSQQGLQYKTYQTDPMGNVKTLDRATATASPAQLNPGGTSVGQVTQTVPSAQSMTPGIKWFRQQPLVPPTPAVDSSTTGPFATNPVVDPIASNPEPLGSPLWKFLGL